MKTGVLFFALNPSFCSHFAPQWDKSLTYEGAGVRGLGGGTHKEALCPPAHGRVSGGRRYLQHWPITHCYNNTVNDHSAILGIAGMRRGSAISRRGVSRDCEQKDTKM